MMTVARGPKMYNSFELTSNFLQMRDNVHLFLLCLGMIKDEEKVEIIDVGWDSWDFGPRYLQIRTEDKDIKIDAEQFDEFVERGFQL